MAENIKQLSNAFSLGGGLNINSNQPIDSRFKVQSLVELTYDWKNKNNGGEISKYEGLLTYVEEVGKTFRYRTGASYTQGETIIANWELVPVSADDINSLVEIPEVDIQSISVNGETVTPVDGNVNIIIPEVVHPEYSLVAGDTNSVKLLKDGEAAGEVSISLTADVVTTTEENTEKVTALSLATEQNIGKIILVKTAEGDYLAGTYIVDGIGSVKYLATTTGTVDDGDVDAKISSAIDSLDSSISAESGFLTGVTIENGKLVSYTSATVPEAPTYTAGDNISIEDNVISALGYTYDAEKNSFAVGGGTATGQNSYAEGTDTTAYGAGSHAEGKGSITTLTGYNWDVDSKSIVFESVQSSIKIGSILKIKNGDESIFVKVTAISENGLTITVDKTISLEYNENSSLSSVTGIAYSEYSHAEGYLTTASSYASHSEGFGAIASGDYAHAEGWYTIASKSCAHTEGQYTKASAYCSHAEGDDTTASGYASHSEGSGTIASGGASHAEGGYTTASNDYEHAQGYFNVSNKNSNSFGDAGNTIHSIGIGTSYEARMNAQEVMQNGDFYVINVGGYDGTNINDEGVKTLQEVIEDVTSDLGDYKIKDVNVNDTVLTVDTNGILSSAISLKYESKTEGEGEEAVTYPVINLYGKDATTPISTIDVSEFVKDGFLSSASYDEETHKLTLTWNTDSDIKTPTVIDLSGLVDVHDVVGGDGADDLVQIEVAKTNENGVLTFTVSANETNLQNKLDEINGAFIKSVVDNDTATYVKVNAATDAQVVTISVDESTLSTKLGEIDGKFDDYLPYDNIDTTKNEGTLVGSSLNVDENNKLSVSLDETKLGEKITNIEGRITELENAEDADTKCESATINAGTTTELTEGEVAVLSNTTITLSGDGTSLTGTATAVNVVTKQYVTGIETALDERITALENEVDDDTKCESATINAGTPAEAATEGEVTVLSNTTITLSGDGTSLTGTATAVNVVTKQYVDDRFDSLVDNDTKCESATINADAEVEVPTVDEVDVLKNVAIDLSGDGTSLTGTATAVKVVTKQYVDGKFAEVPTYTAITTSEIDGIFTQG